MKNNRRFGYYSTKVKDNCYYRDNIQISSALQGKGIGTYIMNKIEKEAKQLKKHCIQLTVFKDNPAKRLYEKTGFSIIENKGGSVLMEKKV
ncbi:GNAT family N-acetyltransferase [Patescibacteria group bacterium]|nr:GNAT family N-acetyltransferase [Patescibacteria group bacterium]MBU1722054.1 GNAT family N-acetyltransferase [Patescibacteria group bacterium]MBU1901524.1 GNAT family N-acetyltransferase [Patescibacteria group bacterium]